MISYTNGSFNVEYYIETKEVTFSRPTHEKTIDDIAIFIPAFAMSSAVKLNAVVGDMIELRVRPDSVFSLSSTSTTGDTMHINMKDEDILDVIRDQDDNRNEIRFIKSR